MKICARSNIFPHMDQRYDENFRHSIREGENTKDRNIGINSPHYSLGAKFTLLILIFGSNV